jgi:hypothetical protein
LDLDNPKNPYTERVIFAFEHRKIELNIVAVIAADN